MAQSVQVELDAAVDPLILALDVGTSSTRALIFDARGRFVEPYLTACHYEPQTTHDGGVVLDAETLFEQVAATIDAVLRDLRRPIAAVACDTFWHSLLATDDAGTPLSPIFTWADTRSAQAADELRQQLDAKAVHQRTGAILHSSYLPAKLLWLSQIDPRVVERASYWMSFGEYAYLRLFGERRVSVSMASGTGLFDQRRCVWDQELIGALPVDEAQLSPIADYDCAMSGLKEPFRSRWPPLASIPWYLALGDGACSNVGSGGTSPEWVVAMIGTSGALRVVRETDQFDTPEGLWTYRVDRRHIVQGGALSDGGNVYAWLEETLRLGSDEDVERGLAAMRPDAHGLTVLPFLAGERSPNWNASARAAFVGIGLDTKPLDIVRASLEAVAYRFGIVYGLLEPSIQGVKGIIGSGAGLLKSPAWMQIMSDVLGREVWASQVAEASSRGAALLALEAMGALPPLEKLPVPVGRHHEPNPEHTAIYRDAMRRQLELYQRIIHGTSQPFS